MRTILCLTAALALIMNLACGKAPEETAETALEQQIEKSAGGDADVDYSDEGMEITTEDADGVSTWQAGDKAELPDNFPSDVYIPEGVSVDMVSDSPSGTVVALSTDIALATIVEAYLKEMTAAGWTKMTDTEMDGGRMTLFLKDERTVNVGIFDEDGARGISLSVSK